MISKPNLKEIANKYQVSEKQVLDIYRSVFKFIKERIKELPQLNTVTSEEDFKKLKTNFNIPLLGKLGITYEKVQYLNNVINGKTIKNKKYKADVYGNNNNNG